MDPLTISAIASGLGSGISYLTGRANRKSQERQNQQDRQWELDMYNRQRGHALDDWNMQNAYNHPKQQLQRLREAGLNAQMMYGGGAQMTGSIVRSTSSQGSSKPAPQMRDDILPRGVADTFGAMNALWQGKQIQAQTDNLAVQNEVLKKEALLKAAQTWKTIAETDKSKQDYGQAARINDLIFKSMQQDIQLKDLDIQKRPYDIKNVEASTKKMEAETKRTLTENEVAQLMKEPNLRLALQELALKQAHTIREEEEIKIAMERLTNQQLDNAIKDIQLQMQKDGVNPGDPYYYRLMYQLWLKFLGL